jgi:outer membrane protein TolC
MQRRRNTQPSFFSNGASILVSRAVLASSLVLLAGCHQGGVFEGNPFATSDSDLRSTALSRLREIQPLESTAGAAVTGAKAESADEATLRANVLAMRESFEKLPSMEVSLEQARQSALSHNLDLQVALIDPAIAQENVTIEANRFNTLFDLRATYEDGRQATGSRVSTQESRTFRLTPGFKVPMRTGGEISIDPFISRVEQDNEFAQVPEFYNTGATVSVSQPLLRNAGRWVNLASLRIANYESQGSLARTKLEAINQLTEVERSYWQLYAARAALGVRAQQLELANQQLDTARRRVEQGASPQVEVDRARAGVAQRVEALILAQNDVLDRQRGLKASMNTPGLTLDTPTAIVPSTLPDPVELVLDRSVLTQAAMQNRMELLDLEMQLAADAARVLLDRNAALPDLRFLASYGASGLDEDFGEALDNASDRQSREWSVGASLSMPLDNEAARARLRASLLRHMQRGASKQSRELAIQRQVLRACDNLETAWQRILATRLASLAAGTALASEQRQFDIGKATSTNVLDAAANLASAQLSEIQSLTDYQIAMVELASATGTLLGQAKVDLTQQLSDVKADASKPDPKEPGGNE